MFVPLAPYKGILIPESGKFLLVESRILGFLGIRKTALEIQNSANDWNPESKLRWQRSGIQCLESGIHKVWNPEGKTQVLDPCWWGHRDRMNGGVSHRQFWFLSLHWQWIIHVYIIHVFTFLSIITINYFWNTCCDTTFKT